MAVNIKLVAFQGAPEAILANATIKLNELCPNLNFVLESTEVDVIFFITGGSEMNAIECLLPDNQTVLLAGDEVNAWAAATEVKAYANQKCFFTQLISTNETDLERKLMHFVMAKQAILKLKAQRLGLIGEVSDWLVASKVPTYLLEQVFGIQLIELSYDALPDYLKSPADAQFPEVFTDPTIQQKELASISGFLKEIVAQYQLDAITIQCFKMVRDKNVTACLPVALMNYNGVPAGCEGDLVSIASIMFVKALLGQIPWMANLIALKEASILLAHCTVPLQHINDYELDTHYETNLSSSIRGNWTTEDVTILRLNQSLDTAFVAEGKVLGIPKIAEACRTQLEVGLDPSEIAKLKSNPLGNHHLVIPGKYAALLITALKMKNIKCI